MEAQKLLEALHTAERLKDTMRHCYTSGGRRESVAEHSWRITLMALFLKDDFPDADMDKVIRMCIIHDLGECFTGDIPVFMKTDSDEEKEELLLKEWVDHLPSPVREEMRDLYQEMAELETQEARIYKSLDGLEAIVQHNESDIRTWEKHEYNLNMTYADERTAFSPVMHTLREAIREETREKIRRAAEDGVTEAKEYLTGG